MKLADTHVIDIEGIQFAVEQALSCTEIDLRKMSRASYQDNHKFLLIKS